MCLWLTKQLLNVLFTRSLKTLKVRMEEHQKNSLQVGRWLEKHPAIVSVRHPGLPSHPQHNIVLKQCYGHSGMISFYLRGKLEQSRKFLSALKVKGDDVRLDNFSHDLVDTIWSKGSVIQIFFMLQRFGEICGLIFFFGWV